MNKLARVLFKKTFDRLNEQKYVYEKRNRDLAEIVRQKQDELDLLENGLHRIADIHTNGVTTYESFIKLTDQDELVLITVPRKNPFTMICLYGVNGSNRGLSDCHMNLSFSEGIVTVEDFLSRHQKRGYGRALMTFLVDYCRNYGEAQKITGVLSQVDKANFEWLIPFYESFGFEVVLDGDNGRIILDM